MLSDSNSQLIRAFGILNTEIEPESRAYGIPHPGLYIIDENLIVKKKQFESAYSERPSGESVLAVHFDENLPHQKQFELPFLNGLVALADTSSYPSQMHAVQFTFQLDEGFHLYGRPIPQGYIPLDIVLETQADVSLDSLEYPQTESFTVESLDETFHILPAQFTLKTFLRTAKRPELGRFDLTFTITMQACDDRLCYPPHKEQVRFPFHISRSLND